MRAMPEDVDVNPYDSPRDVAMAEESGRSGRTVGASASPPAGWSAGWSAGTIASHVLGGVTLLTGASAIFIAYTIPAAHPAMGGPSIAAVVTFIIVSFSLCLVLGISVAINAALSKRWLRLIYLLPAAAFIAMVVSEVLL